MDKLLFVLMLIPWVYAIGLLMYFVILFNHKKKLPWGLVIADLVFMGLFLYLHNLLYQEKIAFVGSYKRQQGEFDMATEIANVETTCANIGIGIAIFAIVQFLLMKYINKQISKLNDPPPVEYHKKGGII